MAKNKKPNENVETMENNTVLEIAESIDADGSNLELVQSGTQAMFSYGLGESLAMEDIEQRIFYIDGEINENIFREVNAFIMKFNAADAGIPSDERVPIKLIISSGGGQILDGLGTIECIRNSIVPVIAVCTSYACSMAFYIFASAHVRLATANAAFLNHDGEMYIGNSTSKTEDTVAFYKKITGRLNKMLASRSKFTIKELEDTKRIENWFFGDEARDLGIVDGIIGEDVAFEDIFTVDTDCCCGECDG